MPSGTTLEAVVSGGAKRFSLLPPIPAGAIEAAGESWSPDLFRRLLLPTTRRHDPALLTELESHGVGAMQQCTVAAGDAILIPCNWYHATENLPPSGMDPPKRGETVQPTIAIAMQWSASWDAEVYPTRVGKASDDFCPVDVHADFRQHFAHVVRLSGEGQTAQAAELLHKACRYTPIFVHCTVGLARLYAGLGQAGDARETLLAGAASHRVLHAEAVIEDEVLATVLGLVATELADLNQPQEAGYAVGKEWVEGAWFALAEAAHADASGSDPLLQIRCTLFATKLLLVRPDRSGF